MAWQSSSAKLIKDLGAEKISGDECFFQSWGTDTRRSLENSLFIALKGDSFDAHDFLKAAVDQGATGLLVHQRPKKEDLEELKNINPDLVVILVSDTLLAIQTMANLWRKESSFKVIAVTGSNGKTTTKEFCTQMLASKYKVYAPQGSLNNHWGVAFCLLSADKDCDFVFCEMGMNHPGEIARLCEIAEPDFVGVSMVGRGHLEGMGSLEAVAKEKSQIYVNSPNARKVFNLDNPFTRKMYVQFFGEGDLCFSEKEKSDIEIHCRDSDLGSMNLFGKIMGESFQQTLSIFGRHNTVNLMLASGLCVLAGMNAQEIIGAMNLVKMAWGRNQVMSIKDWTVVFDAYNANPESMQVFVQNAENLKIQGNKHLILGEMLEMGADSPSYHKELAELAFKRNFSSVHFFGLNFKQFELVASSSKIKEACVFSDTYKEDLAIKIKNMLKPGDAIFIKASRGMQFEKFLEILKS